VAGDRDHRGTVRRRAGFGGTGAGEHRDGGASNGPRSPRAPRSSSRRPSGTSLGNALTGGRSTGRRPIRSSPRSTPRPAS
jgi:hypothetical protein